MCYNITYLLQVKYMKIRNTVRNDLEIIKIRDEQKEVFYLNIKKEYRDVY